MLYLLVKRSGLPDSGNLIFSVRWAVELLTFDLGKLDDTTMVCRPGFGRTNVPSRRNTRFGLVVFEDDVLLYGVPTRSYL